MTLKALATVVWLSGRSGTRTRTVGRMGVEISGRQFQVSHFFEMSSGGCAGAPGRAFFLTYG